jgi:hypothetical protein
MRFRKGMTGVTPILSAIAPESTMERPDGHHSGNPTVRESVKNKEKQHVAWAAENEGGQHRRPTRFTTGTCASLASRMACSPRQYGA